MKKIKIEIFHAAFFQLSLENFLHLIHIGKIVAGKFCRQIKALPRITFQNFSHRPFGFPVMVAPGRVIIIDAVPHSIVDHLRGGFFVYRFILAVYDRQAHGSEAERR